MPKTAKREEKEHDKQAELTQPAPPPAAGDDADTAHLRQAKRQFNRSVERQVKRQYERQG